MRLRNERIYVLFTFLFVAYSSLRVTPPNSGLSSWGPALPFQPRLQGGPDLISSYCGNSKDVDVLPGKRLDWMQRWKQCCLLLLLMLCLAISAHAIPIPMGNPGKPSCQPGDKDLVAPACEDSVRVMLLYKRTVVILYSSGVPLMVCLMMAWNFWKAPRE